MHRKKFPYWEWEDYCAGLYRLEWRAGAAAKDSMLILGSPVETSRGMNMAVELWPKAAAHHLTDGGMNQRAWLGWAACGILSQIPAHVTRQAWWRLTEEERFIANGIADQVIAAYANPYANKLF